MDLSSLLSGNPSPAGATAPAGGMDLSSLLPLIMTAGKGLIQRNQQQKPSGKLAQGLNPAWLAITHQAGAIPGLMEAQQGLEANKAKYKAGHSLLNGPFGGFQTGDITKSLSPLAGLFGADPTAGDAANPTATPMPSLPSMATAPAPMAAQPPVPVAPTQLPAVSLDALNPSTAKPPAMPESPAMPQSAQPGEAIGSGFSSKAPAAGLAGASGGANPLLKTLVTLAQATGWAPTPDQFNNPDGLSPMDRAKMADMKSQGELRSAQAANLPTTAQTKQDLADSLAGLRSAQAQKYQGQAADLPNQTAIKQQLADSLGTVRGAQAGNLSANAAYTSGPKTENTNALTNQTNALTLPKVDLTKADAANANANAAFTSGAKTENTNANTAHTAAETTVIPSESAAKTALQAAQAGKANADATKALRPPATKPTPAPKPNSIDLAKYNNLLQKAGSIQYFATHKDQSGKMHPEDLPQLPALQKQIADLEARFHGGVQGDPTLSADMEAAKAAAAKSGMELSDEQAKAAVMAARARKGQ